MNLQAMRDSFSRRASGLADDLPNGVNDIDAYLSHAYQHTIPDVIPGQLTEAIWELTTVGLTAEYDFPDWVHSVKRGARIGNFDLVTYTTQIEFWHRHDPEDTASSKPVSVLVFGRQVRFHKIPNVEYVVTFPVRSYPFTGTGNARTLAVLTATGIPYYTHANAVVWRGIEEFADDFDLTDLMTKATVKADESEKLLRKRSLTRPRERRRRRTY